MDVLFVSGCGLQAPAADSHFGQPEWKVVKELLRPAKVKASPHGEWFIGPQDAVFFHGGWGKIASSASTECAIARWNPKLAWPARLTAMRLCSPTKRSDIVEMMGDSSEAIRDYSTEVDLSWIPASAVAKLPSGTIRTALLPHLPRRNPCTQRGSYPTLGRAFRKSGP